MEYVYPAILYKDKKLPDTWTVIFPDVEGAATCGYSLYEALAMAEDALAGMLASWEDAKAGKKEMTNRIVAPTPIDDIKAEPDEYSEKAITTLIKVDTDLYRKAWSEMPHGEAEEIDDERELPETLVRAICKSAGIAVPA